MPHLCGGGERCCVDSQGGDLRHIKVLGVEKVKPDVVLIDRPCDEAIKILETCANVSDVSYSRIYSNDMIVWTALTPFNGRVVACPCTGIDHIKADKVIYLDKEWKASQGLMVTSTAEHTFSLILQLAKLNKMQLYGKTLGIIGYGRLGSMVAEYADAFGMEVMFNDVDKTIRDWFISIPLNHLFEKSDIISIHVPLNDETKGMIGYDEFRQMKIGALLINTSRPEIVNEQALMYNLVARLDGFADDFRDSHNIILKYDNVISTPHIGGNCKEARIATDVYIANKVKEYILGQM